jgi:hypothetical protein
MTESLPRPRPATSRSTTERSIAPGTKTRAAPLSRNALPRAIASSMLSSIGRSPPRTIASVRAFSWKSTPSACAAAVIAATRATASSKGRSRSSTLAPTMPEPMARRIVSAGSS